MLDFSGLRILVLGDVMLDASLRFRNRAQTHSSVLDRLGVVKGEFVLVTVHRAENTDDPARLDVILRALTQVAASRDIVWPVHPRTRKAIQARGAALLASGRARLVDPVGYLDMVMLESSACAIASSMSRRSRRAALRMCVARRPMPNRRSFWSRKVSSIVKRRP